MQYTNYVMKNNVFSELYAPISSLATTIQLKSGQGARRGTSFPILATLEAVESGKVIKREIVKITAVSGDYLTVVRGFAPCPPNDDSNTQGTTTFSFGADDRINMYVPKEIFDKISDSLNDIYDNGVNKLRTEVVSGLEIKVGAGPILVGSAYYDFTGDTITLADNATNYIEIDEDGLLVANTTSWNDTNTKIAKVITNNGEVISIEDWRLGTVGGRIGGVNIHDLTEKNTLSGNDELIISDSENVYNNKKIKAKKIPNINGLDSKDMIETSDLILIEDSNDNYNNKKISIGNFMPFNSISREGQNTYLGNSDTMDYICTWNNLNNINYLYLYNKQGFLQYTADSYTLRGSYSKFIGAFIYNNYIYTISYHGSSTTRTYLDRCELGKDITVSSNRETIANVLTTSIDGGFVGFNRGKIYYTINGNTTTIRVYDLTLTQTDTITFISMSLNVNYGCCAMDSGFIIYNNSSSQFCYISIDGQQINTRALRGTITPGFTNNHFYTSFSSQNQSNPRILVK